MTATPNLGIEYMESSQSQPEIIFNEAMNKIDAAVGDPTSGGSPLEVELQGSSPGVENVTKIIFDGPAASVAAGANPGEVVVTIDTVSGGSSGGGGGSGGVLIGDAARAQLPHLYWRINILNSGFSSNSGFAEISMAATPGGSNQLSGGTISAIGADGGNPASYGADGNTATSWNYASNQSWWQYQFATAVKVEEVKITARTDAPTTSPSSFRLEFSDDGVNFLELQFFAASLPWTTGQVQTFTVASVAIGGGASTVALLPASPAQGDRSFVTDATATTFLSTVAGGGSDKVPVVYDGTNWVIG